MISDGAMRVRVGLLLTQNLDTERKDCLVVNSEDRHSVDYTAGEDEEQRSFSFDHVINVDNIQRFPLEFLQPLSESICCGYNATLLIAGNPRTGTEGILIDHGIIKQALSSLFSHISSTLKEELFTTVSFVKFYQDDSAVDFLGPERQVLRPVSHPVLGCLVGELSEVSVISAEDAYALYETCLEMLKADAGMLSSRCSFLFSVAVEQKLHSEDVEPEFCRNRLQLFSLAGGASKTDLRGVSPLVKALDQIQSGDTTSDKLLPFLLMDALTGNSRTALLYCIQPQGVLDDETPSALALAQRVRGFVTKATHGRWCPGATEKEIRDNILELRTKMMSQGEHGAEDTLRLAELTRNLQMVKDQSWEKRREKSEKIKDKLKGYQSPKSNLHPAGDHISDHRETTETVKYLQDQLKLEMEEHIREGRGSVRGVQERISRIQKLRVALREERGKHGVTREKSYLSQQSQWEYNKAQERRRRLKEDHGRLIQEEVEKMERELGQEQVEGPQRELVVLGRERQVLVLQMEALRTEAQQAERDLEEQYGRHQQELHSLREESLQVFRVFRQVSEEQRRIAEGRYRTLLLEAVQDAVFLSAQNQQLQADNKQLRIALAELKDTIAVRGDHKVIPATAKE